LLTFITKILIYFQHHHYQQIQPPVAVTPAPTVLQQRPPVVQQQLVNQFNPQSQPVLSQAAAAGVANGQQVQYVQLTNGLLVPVGSVSHPHLATPVAPTNYFFSQQNLPQAGGQVPMNLQCYQTAGAGIQPQSPQQFMQQQLLQQQLQQQQQQLQQQQQQLIALGADPRSQQHQGMSQSHHELFQNTSPQQQQLQQQQLQQQQLQQQQLQQQQLQQQQLQQQQQEQQPFVNGVETADGLTTSNTRKAQKKQINLSKDAGFKCSQI
jgi:hypothetical protein